MDVNSGTLHLAGVRDVARLYEPEFAALGFTVRWIPMPDSLHRAGHLVAERAGTHGTRVLFIGHLDTVYEADSPFQRFVRQGDRAVGPGTNDMKGGNLIILYALKALAAAGALDGTRIIVINLLGRIFMEPSRCPFEIVDEILSRLHCGARWFRHISDGCCLRILQVYEVARSERARSFRCCSS